MAYNTTILADSPLIYFQLNETSGTTFANSGSNGGASSAIGAGVTKGQSGVDGSNAILLSGTSTGYFTASSTPNFMSDNQFSVEAWVKTTTSGAKTIVAYNPGSRGFSLGTNSSNRATFSIMNNNGTSTVTASGSTNLINDGNWHHIVATAASATLTIYVDGVSTQNTSALGGTYGITGDFVVGATSSGFTGTVDEVALYDGALTSTQVTTHFNAWVQSQAVNYNVPAMTASGSMPGGVVQKIVNAAIDPMTASASAPSASVSITYDDIVYNPTADTYTNPSDGINYGTSTSVRLLTSAGAYTFFKFDLSAFPAGFDITNGKMRLYRDSSSSSGTLSFSLYTWNNIWSESARPNVSGGLGTLVQSYNVGYTNGQQYIEFDIPSSEVSRWKSANNGFVLYTTTTGMDFNSRQGSQPPTVTVSRALTVINAGYSATAMTANASMHGGEPKIDRIVNAGVATASASAVAPSFAADTFPSVAPMTASASMVNPSLVIPDRNVDVPVMTASANMPGGYYTANVAISAAAATASASMPSVSVTTELNARVSAAVMVAGATIIPPLEAQGNDSDPYYIRLNSQVTETTALWYRMDETSGTVAHNERGGGDGTYVGGPTLGLSGLEGRKIVRFDGVNDGIVFPDNDALTAQGTYEFVFRTTKATETIVQGIDFNFNNFGGALRGTMIGLTNGKIDIFPSNKGQYTGTTTLNDGRWHHVVVTFFRFGNSALDYPGQVAVYVDGKVELKRYLLENQIFVAIPDGLGGIGSRADGLPVTIGERVATIPFEGDIMEFVFRPGAVLDETTAIRNYYYAFGYSPIYPEAMTASATMPDAIGKGNQKRALALFWSTDTDENLNVPNYWDVYNWTGIRTSDTYAAVGPLLSHYRLSGTFDLGGFKVFPRSIQRNETASVDNDYLGGAYYDYVTGEQRYIDLTTDIDVSGYDMVFFLNLPPTSANQPGGVAASGKNWENMVDALRAAQDEYGFSIWSPQPQLAAQLGVIDRWTAHSMLRETFASDSQGNASGLYDARGVQINPWNTGTGELADPKFYYDTHAANKYRIVSLVDDLTTLGGYIVDDYFYGRPRDPYKIPFEGWKYRDVSGGLQIGDEMYYPQDFWAIGGSSSWFGVYNQRRSVVAVPPENVKAGTVVTRENDTHYVNTSEVANPFANYATSIIVKPGDTLKGRQVNGKIYVNFMEGADGNFGALRKQIVPPNDQITNPLDREDDTKRAWDYASFRVTATAQTGSTTGPTGGAGQIPVDENTEVEPPNTGGGVIVSVNESEKYQVVFLDQISMLSRAFNWMAIRDEVGPGDRIVRPDVMQANAAMPMPVVNAEKSVSIHSEAMLAGAVMVPTTNAKGPDAEIKVFPMTALGFMPGVGRTINVEPMTAIGTMPFTFDMVHAGGEQIVLYLHYSDAIVFVKEDA